MTISHYQLVLPRHSHKVLTKWLCLWSIKELLLTSLGVWNIILYDIPVSLFHFGREAPVFETRFLASRFSIFFSHFGKSFTKKTNYKQKALFCGKMAHVPCLPSKWTLQPVRPAHDACQGLTRTQAAGSTTTSLALYCTDSGVQRAGACGTHGGN